MAKRCPHCRAPLKEEIVFHRKIGTDNKPQLYHYVRRYSCPEGCTVRLDFSKAKPLKPGMRPMVLPRVKPLKEEAGFNDKLVFAGYSAMLLLFIIGILLIPTTFVVKGTSIALLSVLAVAVYFYANQRVELPDTFPLPIPEPEPEPEPNAEEAQAVVGGPGAGTATATATKKKASVEIEIPSEIPDLERKEGEPIKMTVILEGSEYELEVNDGENMLDAALDRDVELDYSCREGMCDSCVVRILAGANNISEPTQEEYDMLGDEVKEGLRLSCQVKVNGPVKILQE